MRNNALDFLRGKPIGHRGLCDPANGIPENSLASMREAVAHDRPVEIDVQLTKDGELVMFHDSSLRRMTGTNGNVSKKNYDEIKDLKLQGTDERIPTLHEVLRTIGGRVPIIIEIKNSAQRENDPEAQRITKAVLDVTKNYTGQLAFLAFNPFILENLKRARPGVPVGLDFGPELPFRPTAFKDCVKRNACGNNHKFDFLSQNALTGTPQHILDTFNPDIPRVAWGNIGSQKKRDKLERSCHNVMYDGHVPEDEVEEITTQSKATTTKIGEPCLESN
jgi:glycerophosphoryl diester phosphodiesterase